MKFVTLNLALLALLTACTETKPPPHAALDTCGADMLQHLVGIDRRKLKDHTLPGRVRILRSGEPVVPGHVPDQINVGIDKNERIGRVFCG